MDLLQMRIDAVDQATSIINQYPGPIMIACAVVGTGIVAYYAQRWMDKRKPTTDEVEMKRRAQRDEMWADRFGDVLFNAYVKGEITGKEYRADCRRYNIAYRFPFSLSYRNKERALAARVKKNCAEVHHTPAVARNGERKQLGPVPGSDLPSVTLVIPKPAVRKVWVVHGTAKLRRKSA